MGPGPEGRGKAWAVPVGEGILGAIWRTTGPRLGSLIHRCGPPPFWTGRQHTAACEGNLSSPPNPQGLWSTGAVSGGEATTSSGLWESQPSLRAHLSAWWSALSTLLKCPGGVRGARVA